LNDTEAIDFLANYAFVAYPSVREWVASTEKPNDTVRIWAKALTRCNRDECQTVIDSWLDGSIEAPKYLRDGFATHIRQCVVFQRAKEKKQQMQADLKNEIGTPKPRTQTSSVLGPTCTEIFAIAARYKSGEIAIDEARRLQHEAIEAWDKKNKRS
jgi:hypothetical protein